MPTKHPGNFRKEGREKSKGMAGKEEEDRGNFKTQIGQCSVGENHVHFLTSQYVCLTMEPSLSNKFAGYKDSSDVLVLVYLFCM